MWSLLTTFIPLLILGVLFGVRKKHPWNLIVFSLFTASWAYSLGVACVFMNNRLFISVMGATAFNTACIMVFAHIVSYDNFNCCSCSLVITLMSIVTMFISYGIYPEELWGNHMACHHMHTFWLVDLLGHRCNRFDCRRVYYWRRGPLPRHSEHVFVAHHLLLALLRDSPQGLKARQPRQI